MDRKCGIGVRNRDEGIGTKGKWILGLHSGPRIKKDCKRLLLCIPIIVPLFFVACQSSSSTESTATLPSLPDGVTTVNYEDWGTITDNGYVINSNPWNEKKAPDPHAQGIFTGVSNGVSFFGWQWNWNNSNDYTILAYPEVFCGNSPFGSMGTIGHTPGYPYAIGGHSFHSTFDISIATSPVKGEECWDLAYDIWILSSSCDTANYGRSDIKCEIMVWLDSEGALLSRWLGNPADTITGNGSKFDYYYYENQADGNGPGGTHPYAAFSSEKPIHSSSGFDFAPFLSYLEAKGVLTANDYVATIELGTEVVIGSGQTIVRNYSVSVGP